MDHGVLLVDKARGMSSHDVVARARKLLKTRQVGHAGTLDPMATGLLLLLVGEATKLSPFLTADRKRYRAQVALGVGTDSLDADGQVTERAEAPRALLGELSGDPALAPSLRAAVAAEQARREQIPPAVSAIHVDGERAYERARRGEEVSLAPRPVEVFSLDLVSACADPPSICVEVEASKGFYVRALGRDLGAHLGLPAHLTSLRRLRSGVFDVAEARSLPDLAPLIAPGEAARRAMPSALLTERGALRASRGQPLDDDDFQKPPGGSPSAWFDTDRLVAVGERREGRWAVLRGFNL